MYTFVRTHLPILVGVACAVALLLIAGVYHLAPFETTDEHLWKYQRIPQYWHAIANGDWAKTYINDKPGVTVVLFSGIGLLREPHPAATQFAPHAAGDADSTLFKKYDTAQTEAVNFAFRAPVVILGALTLIGIFLLLRVAYGIRAAVFATILIGTNPILIGISQIINPDAFFWMFGALGFAAYAALEKTGHTRYVILTGLFTGFALLSKYTAFTLFVLYILFSLSTLLFGTVSTQSIASRATALALRLAAIGVIALALFAILLPATIADPGIMLRGIGQFLPQGMALPVVIALIVIGIALWYALTRYGDRALAAVRTHNRTIAVAVSILFLGTIGFAACNTWTGQRLVPFDNLRNAVYANEPATFNFKPYIASSAKIEKRIKGYFTNAYPLTFSLTPVMLAGAIFGGAWLTLRRRDASRRVRILFVTVAAFTLIYLLLTIKAKVIINVRYTIVLYPLFAILTALVIDTLITRYGTKIKDATYWTVFTLLLIGAGTLWYVAPFYFSYTNALLPRAFAIHDSWGHGSYEAAQYLNALPGAKDLIIWSNSDTTCRFFVGTCLRSRKIDLSVVTPDYFVINKRGVLKERNQFILHHNPVPHKDAGYYMRHLHTNAVWEMQILHRPSNFISIIPYERP